MSPGRRPKSPMKRWIFSQSPLTMSAVADPDGRVRLLERLGIDGEVAELVVRAVVAHAIPRPQRGDRLQHLVHAPAALLVRHAHEPELLLVPAHAHAQDAPAIRYEIQ